MSNQQQQQQVNITDLSVAQLAQVKKQLEDVRYLADIPRNPALI